MGIFSSKEVKVEKSSASPFNANYYRQVQLREQYRQEQLRKHEDLVNAFRELSIKQTEVTRYGPHIPQRVPTVVTYDYGFQPVLIKRNYSLLNEFLYNSENCMFNSGSAYNLTVLDDKSIEFINIKRLFTKTNKKCFTITSIEKIHNHYLLVQYKLMEKNYKRRYGYVNEVLLFHGTKRFNIENICKYNFDWRLKGSAKGHMFGQGVSFTPIANYATHYGDKTYEKVIIVATVLVSKKCVGKENTVLPPLNYDTTIKADEHVYVKYEDNTFYPAYIIHYQGQDRNSNYNKNSRNQLSLYT